MYFRINLMFIPQNIVDDLRQRDCEELADRLGIEISRHKAYCFCTPNLFPVYHSIPQRKMYGIAFHVVRAAMLSVL